jgi:hypothetical protein
MTNKTKAIIASAAIAGLLSGSAIKVFAGDFVKTGTAATEKGDKASCKGGDGCKGKNECKGKGGCKSGDNGCKGKNSCKGKGGCKAETPKDGDKK